MRAQGNVILTDWTYTILSLLRPRVDNDDVKFAVRERYPVEVANQRPVVTLERYSETMHSFTHSRIHAFVDVI